VKGMVAAQALGLLLAPKVVPGNLDLPVVGDDVELDKGDGTTIQHKNIFYYEGSYGYYFNFGTSPLAADRVTVPTMPLYELHNEGGEPVSEPTRGVDFDGDGAKTHTNDIFPAVPGGATYSPLCQIVSVAIPPNTLLIDRSPNSAVTSRG